MFSKDFRGSLREGILAVFVGFSFFFFPKRQGKEDQETSRKFLERLLKKKTYKLRDIRQDTLLEEIGGGLHTALASAEQSDGLEKEDRNRCDTTLRRVEGCQPPTARGERLAAALQTNSGGGRISRTLIRGQLQGVWDLHVG